MLREGLTHLHTHETIAVADWCDDGSYAIDQEPAASTGRAIDAADRVLTKPAFANTSGSTRAGELALQAMLRSIADTSSKTHPRPMPVLLFLHRDVTGAPNEEVIRLLKILLENSSIGYVLNDGKGFYPFSKEYLLNNTGFVLRTLSEQMGGAAFAVKDYPQDELAYAAVLANILDRLHGRYQLGFIPQVRDGKVHTLKVRLSDEGKQRHPGLLLGSRLSYLAPSSDVTNDIAH